jgi:hypothetical protein
LTTADFTLTIAIQNIVWGLSQAPVGAIADRFGLRVTLVAGTVIYIAGLAAMAAAGGEMALRRRASPRRLRATSDRPNRLHRCEFKKAWPKQLRGRPVKLDHAARPAPPTSTCGNRALGNRNARRGDSAAGPLF